jgi:hypothetical protein
MAEQTELGICEWWRLECLNALTAAGAPAITTTYSGIGIVAADDCCGSLIVTPERTYRSNDFPNEYAGPDDCMAPWIVEQMLVTLVRCVPTLDDRLNAPTAAALQEAHTSILADKYTIWETVKGPVPDEFRWERAVYQQQMVGGEGGCMIVETRFLLGVLEEDWCPPS